MGLFSFFFLLTFENFLPEVFEEFVKGQRNWSTEWWFVFTGDWGSELWRGNVVGLSGLRAQMSDLWQTVQAQSILEAKIDSPPHDSFGRQTALLSTLSASLLQEGRPQVTCGTNARTAVTATTTTTWTATTNLG